MKLSNSYTVLGKRSVPSKNNPDKIYLSVDLYSLDSGFVSLPCSDVVFSSVECSKEYRFDFSFYPDRRSFPLVGRLFVASIIR